MLCEDKECPYYKSFVKQSEVTQALADLDTNLISLLAQYMDIEEYEAKLKLILKGTDVEVLSLNN